MKRLTGIAAAALMAATAVGAAAVPTVASAQVTVRFGAPGFWTPERTNAIRNQIWQLDAAVDRADQRNTINNREARQLHRQVRVLQNNYNRYSRGGLTLFEVRALQNEVNRVRQQLRLSRLDWDRQDFWSGNRWRDADLDGIPNRMDNHPHNPRRH